MENSDTSQPGASCEAVPPGHAGGDQPLRTARSHASPCRAGDMELVSPLSSLAGPDELRANSLACLRHTLVVAVHGAPRQSIRSGDRGLVGEGRHETRLI